MKNDSKHTTATPTTTPALPTPAFLTTAPLMSAALKTAPFKSTHHKAPALKAPAPTPESHTPALTPAPIMSAAPLAPTLPTPAPLTTAALKTAPFRIAALKTAGQILVIATTLLFLVGCKAKQTTVEKSTAVTDSTSLWNLNDSLYKKETQIATLQSDLQRIRDENIRLLNESSTHQISYDTSAPVNPQTGKPPVASEIISLSKSSLEESKKELETLLQTAALVNETLTQQNHNLQLTVDKLTNENKQLTAKTASTGLNLKPLLAGLLLGLLLSVLIYLILK